jgi:dihydrofolate reductase
MGRKFEGDFIMRRIVASAFVSLDGVMQAPGGPEEDPTGGFAFGGWTAAYEDEAISAAIGEGFSREFELLLGRRTYDIFAAHWPYIASDAEDRPIADRFNSITKHVATHSPDTLAWQHSKPLGRDAIDAVRKLKQGDGPILQIWGSSELIQQLLAADLIDEFQLMIYPLVFGKGKRLFGEGTIPAAFKVTKSAVASNGVVIATYQRAGEVKTGSFALPEPSAAEIERRKKLR